MAVAKRKRTSKARRVPRATRRPAAPRRRAPSKPRRKTVKRKVARTGDHMVKMSLKQHATGQIHPFSNVRPKLLDSTIGFTHSLPNRSIQTVTLAASTVHRFILFPGLCCTMMQITPGGSGFYKNDSGQVYTLNRIDDVHLSHSAVTGTTGQFSREGQINQWRVVSQGMRVDLLNTNEQNDGFFKAWRVNQFPGYNDVCVRQRSTTEWDLVPNVSFWEKYLSEDAKDYTDLPGFVAGNLKSIGGYEFQLRPKTNQRPFISIEDDYTTPVLTNTYEDRQYKSTTFGGDQNQGGWEELSKDFFDRSLDVVILEVTAGTSGTQLLINTVQNQEVMYQPGTSLARFQNESPGDITMHNAVHTSLSRAAGAAQVRGIGGTPAVIS